MKQPIPGLCPPVWLPTFCYSYDTPTPGAPLASWALATERPFMALLPTVWGGPLEGLKVSFEHSHSSQCLAVGLPGLSSGWLLPSSVEIKVVMRWLHVWVILCFPWHPGDSSRLCQLRGNPSTSEACPYWLQYFIVSLPHYVFSALNFSRFPSAPMNFLVQSQYLPVSFPQLEAP